MHNHAKPVITSLTKRAIRLRLMKRRFHAFGVGAPKSGTTSLAKMLEHRYRSMHEPDAAETITRIILRAQDQIGDDELRHYVKAGDTARMLEMNSSSFNVYLLPYLLELFPDSKYVLPIRDCFGWLDSLLSHVTFRTTSPKWEEFRNFRFKSSGDYYEEEHALRAAGFLPVDGYLKYWAWHNQLVLDTVPSDRLLILKTDEISDSLDKIAAFLTIDAETIRAEESRGNIAQRKTAFSGLLPRRFLAQRVKEHCSTLMEAFYPDTMQRFAD